MFVCMYIYVYVCIYVYMYCRFSEMEKVTETWCVQASSVNSDKDIRKVGWRTTGRGVLWRVCPFINFLPKKSAQIFVWCLALLSLC